MDNQTIFDSIKNKVVEGQWDEVRTFFKTRPDLINLKSHYQQQTIVFFACLIRDDDICLDMIKLLE